MNIGKAAKIAGLTVKTARYYANLGLIKPEQNPKTGYRNYSDDDIAKMQFVAAARQFNFSVKECRELLSLFEDKTRSSADVKRITMMKITELDQKLLELQSLRKKLQTLADSCKGDQRPDCPILDALGSM